jgi:hypothetical protein
MSEKNILEADVKPLEIAAGETLNVNCKYSGTLNYGFFDLAIIIVEKEKNTILWFPDENTWNLWRDTGMLTGEGPFFTEWTPFIPDWVPKGEYDALALVYDDKTGKNVDRKPIGQKQFKIKLNDSNHTDAIFTRKLYQRFLGRKPDITGYRTWFDTLQKAKVGRIQVLEIGFLRSPEFRVRFIHTLFNKETISENDLKSSIEVLGRYSISKLVTDKYLSIINNPAELRDRIIEFLGMTEEGKGSQEVRKIEQKSQSIGEMVNSIFGNFLLEKYILMKYLFPESSKEKRSEEIDKYLTDPEEIIKEI